MYFGFKYRIYKRNFLKHFKIKPYFGKSIQQLFLTVTPPTILKILVSKIGLMALTVLSRGQTNIPQKCALAFKIIQSK